MFKQISQKPISVTQQPRPLQVLSITDFSKGLNTFLDPGALSPHELSECLNYYIKDGALKPRPGLTKFSTSVITGDFYDLEPFVISDEKFLIVSTSTGQLYKIAMDGTVTLIKDLTGPAKLFTYSGQCIVCDGSFIKAIDKDGNLVLAYDAGTKNTLYNTLNELQESSVKVYGDKEYGVAFTCPALESGFKLPFFSVEVPMRIVGAPTGEITAKLYDSTHNLLKSSTAMAVASLSFDYLNYTFLFDIDNTDQSWWMEGGADYEVLIKCSGGGASDYIEIPTCYKTDGVSFDGSSWSTGDSLNVRLAPNAPPKASTGHALVRPFFAGDPDNVNYLWFGNLSVYDFSTDNGGGWIDFTGISSASFEMGELGSLFGNLFIFGTERSEFLYELTGQKVEDFTLKKLKKETSAGLRNVLSLPNNLWYNNRAGLHKVRGVTEYGDLRLNSAAKQIYNIYYNNSDKETFIGFDHNSSLLYLQFKGLEETYICHLGEPGNPWAKYKFKSEPQLFKKGFAEFYIGLDDGYLYKLDNSVIQDDFTDNEFTWASAFIRFPFTYVDIKLIQTLASAKGGLYNKLQIFTELDYTDYIQELTVSLPQSGVLVEDAINLLSYAEIPISGQSNISVFPVNIRCSSIMLKSQKCYSLLLDKISLKGFNLQFKGLEM